MIGLLNNLEPSVKMVLMNQLKALQSPFELLTDEINVLISEMIAGHGELYTSLVRSIFRMQDLGISVESQNKLSPFYANYLMCKGTSTGLRILADQLLAGIDIKIIERQHPFNAMRVADPIDDSRLIVAREYALSLILEFNTESSLQKKTSYLDFITLVAESLPPATRIYCLFNDSQITPLARIGDYRL